MGAACRHLDRLAAQPRRLARQVSPRFPGCMARSCASWPPWRRCGSWCRASASNSRRRRDPGEGGREPGCAWSSSGAKRIASWTRDYCPLFVQEPARRDRAHRLAIQRLGEVRQLARRRRHPGAISPGGCKLPLLTPGMVLEGGSIDVNGAGLLLTTEECLLSEVQQRNPGMSREEIEARLREFLGVRQGDLARRRDRGRRYARTRRRPGALRRCRKPWCWWRRRIRADARSRCGTRGG